MFNTHDSELILYMLLYLNNYVMKFIKPCDDFVTTLYSLNLCYCDKLYQIQWLICKSNYWSACAWKKQALLFLFQTLVIGKSKNCNLSLDMFMCLNVFWDLFFNNMINFWYFCIGSLVKLISCFCFFVGIILFQL
jgi:hypothetical protein